MRMPNSTHGRRWMGAWGLVLAAASLGSVRLLIAAEEPAATPYDNQLRPLHDPPPLLADFPEFCEPLVESQRYEAAPLVDETAGDLQVRAWRFSYNARGIVEMPNRLSARHTAVVVVHPWGIDDGQGWRSPEPAGVALCCTPEKNQIYLRHAAQVVDPLLKQLRPHVGLVVYSLPGVEDPIRKQIYRSVRGRPTADDRQQGARQLRQRLHDFDYRGQPVPRQLTLGGASRVASYFRQFPGIDSSARFNHAGFWEQPIPVCARIETAPDDVVAYDAEGYDVLRDFLKSQGIRHVLLAGYNTDMCVCSTTAGYEHLAPDFNLFLVGDATIATFPAANTPRYATQTALAKASLTQLITQVSWIKIEPSATGASR